MASKPVGLESRLKQPRGAGVLTDGTHSSACLIAASRPGPNSLFVWSWRAGPSGVRRREAELRPVAQEVAAEVLDPGAVVADRGAEVSRRREVEVSRPELIR